MTLHASPTLRRPAPAPAPVLRRRVCGGRTADAAEGAAKRLRRSASGEAAPAIVHDVLRSPGAPLDAGTRAAMEPRFGHSFADVRVHVDGRAADSAAAVGAHAYAVGRDVVFGAGRYAPSSADGRRLIAHELAHVVQQSGSAATAIQPSLQVGPSDAPEEREAHAAADAVAAGRPASLAAAPARLARMPGGGTADLHDAVAEAWRRRNGLPAGGVDEMGNPVGPTTAEIVHDARYREPLRPDCPSLDDNRGLYCITAGRSEQDGRTCRMSPAHVALLGSARATARGKVAGAVDRMNRAAPPGPARNLVLRQARRSFAGAPPAWDAILSRLTAVQGLLAGTSMQIEAAACDDNGCWSGGTMAYVRAAGDPNVFVCQRSFARESREHLPTTLVHEAAHVAGVVTEDIRLESYCSDQPCDRSCQPPEHAASWAHFVDCIGGPMFTPRTDFIPEMIRNVEEDL
ncbi:MAG TPA: DUF4157 domain-containing protein [Longimicrobium sp.]|nr:DUF4157 domain-containing protein [Longimicrobium sp.]